MESFKTSGLLTEAQKIMFNKSYYLRFLSSNGFDIENTTAQLKRNIAWRNEHKIDMIMDTDIEH